MLNDAAPSATNRESNFIIIYSLCNKFTGLSPFEVLHRPLDEVLDLYTDAIIHSNKEKQETNGQEVEWVTSKTANWH